ncbi:MAG: DUF167 family protein [Candidatus Dormibacteria bacterium]|jgi:uncharacterized protein YggU (UPF0235/DUF167 family)
MRLSVVVHPRAGRERLEWDGRELRLWITAPPAEGAANAAVVRAVASWLGVAPSRVHLVTGHRGHRKLLDVEGVAPPPGIEFEGPAAPPSTVPH